MSVIGKVLKRFKPPKGSGTGQVMETIGEATDLNEIMGEELAILFKHSTACPVSWAAHAQVTKFLRENENTPVYMIPVIKQRAFSQKVAAVTGVVHESPQVIVLRDGAVAASASHGEITVENLAAMLSAYPGK